MNLNIDLNEMEVKFEQWKAQHLNTRNVVIYALSSFLMIWLFPVVMSMFPPINLFLFMAFWAISPFVVAYAAQQLLKTRKSFMYFSLAVPSLSILFVAAMVIIK